MKRKLKLLAGVLFALMLVFLSSVAGEALHADAQFVTAASKEAPSVLNSATLYASKEDGWFQFTPQETGLYILSVEHDCDLSSGASYHIVSINQNGTFMDEYHFAKKTAVSLVMNSQDVYTFYVKEGGVPSTTDCYIISICEANNHTGAPETRITQKPECESEGVLTKICSICKQPISEESIPATGHQVEEQWTPEIAATCAEPGWEVKRCTVCKAVVERQELPKLAHTESDMQLIQDATCLNPGMKASFCTVCGAQLNTEAILPTGHTVASEWQIIQEPTCTVEGTSAQVCTTCHAVLDTQAIPVIQHTAGQWQDIKPVTCTADGERVQYCTVCNAMLNHEVVPAFGHSPMEWVITREAACLESGLREKKCSICGAALESEEIPALGHSYTEWEVTTEATKEHEGEQRRNCIHCGDTQLEAIPKIPKFLGIF